jgi:hypothetical protein
MNMVSIVNSTKKLNCKFTKEEEWIFEGVTIVKENKEMTIEALDLIDWMVVEHLIIVKLILAIQ